jgi:hypothetical protein
MVNLVELDASIKEGTIFWVSIIALGMKKSAF